MGYRADSQQMNRILTALRDEYNIYGPKKLRGVLRYGEISAIEEVVWDTKTGFSAKEIVHPVVQTMLYFSGGACTESGCDDKKILIFARPCDIHAIQRLDTVFLQNGGAADLYYARLREKVRFILMECGEGFDSCFCVSMGTNATDDYSLAVRPVDGGFLVDVRDNIFAGYFQSAETSKFAPSFVKENTRKLTPPRITPEMLPAIHELAFWKEYSENCLSCGSCNTVCPTCSCFDTTDVIYNETSRSGERRRVWAGCMQEGFTTMAGGHGVRKTPGERMRFKVLHKLYDFNARFGQGQMCVGCGRCDSQCPERISYFDAARRLVDEVESLGEVK